MKDDGRYGTFGRDCRATGAAGPGRGKEPGLDTGISRRLIGAALAAFVLSACAAGSPAPPLPPVADNEGPVASSVFGFAYSRIDSVYLVETNLGDLTVDGLSGLAVIDPDLRASSAATRKPTPMTGAAGAR